MPRLPYEELRRSRSIDLQGRGVLSSSGINRSLHERSSREGAGTLACHSPNQSRSNAPVVRSELCFLYIMETYFLPKLNAIMSPPWPP